MMFRLGWPGSVVLLMCFLQGWTCFGDVAVCTYLRTHVCVHVCARVLLVTSLGNCAYFDAINVKQILMTLQVWRALCAHVCAYFGGEVAKKQHIF